jgi:hypothetical protein
MQFLQFLKQLWISIRSSTIFVAVSTALGTAAYAQVQSWLTTGVFNESPQYWIKTAVGAAAVATAAIYHLNLTPPGAPPTK